MGIWIKQGGVWTEQSGRPHLKLNGQWTPIKTGHVKRSGVWTQFYNFDTVAPSAPNLEVVQENPEYSAGGALRTGRRLRVTVSPSTPSDDTLSLIRTLISTNGQPNSQYDTSLYINARDTNYPNESWSDAFYNYGGFTRDRNLETSKVYTVNQAASTVLGGGTYYVSSWSMDEAGNWSAGTFTQLTLSASYDVTQRSSYTKKWNALTVGTANGTTNNFTSGPASPTISPVRHGIFLYANQFLGSGGIGTHGVNPVITNFQVHFKRAAVDTGPQSSSVYLFPHGYTNGAAVEAGSNIIYSAATKVGTIAKGESKWFNVPSSWWPAFANGTSKGFGISPRLVGGSTYTEARYFSLADASGQGQVAITWSEEATS